MKVGKPFSIRLPELLEHKIKKLAEIEHRSASGQIVHLIELGLSTLHQAKKESA